MSVASALASSVAAINATWTTSFTLAAPLHVSATLPPPVPVLTAATAAAAPAPRRQLSRPRRRAHLYRAHGRRDARIYSWASRSFLAVDPHSEAVTLSKHGNSIYGMLLQRDSNKLEIWGRAQREARRRCKFDWGDNLWEGGS